jgi:hypothetical protein
MMASRIWEVHSQSLGGSIRTTSQGDADIDGLVLSEKAYLLAVRDFRPRQLVEMVRAEGPEGAADRLVKHYNAPDALQAMGGRCLVVCRGLDPVPVVRRSDEVPAKAPAFSRF